MDDIAHARKLIKQLETAGMARNPGCWTLEIECAAVFSDLLDQLEKSRLSARRRQRVKPGAIRSELARRAIDAAEGLIS